MQHLLIVNKMFAVHLAFRLAVRLSFKSCYQVWKSRYVLTVLFPISFISLMLQTPQHTSNGDVIVSLATES